MFKIRVGNFIFEAFHHSNKKVYIPSRSISIFQPNFPSFKHKDLIIDLKDDTKYKTKLSKNSKALVFGKSFTDHMFTVNWHESTGWEKPQIIPYQNLSLDPAIKALHYSLELFDGMKAFLGFDGKIRLFRPELNIQRMLRGSKRLVMPMFDSEEFLECIKTLVEIDKNWIPKPDPNSLLNSLYIRPTFIATEPTLGVMSSNSAQLFVILSPVGSYYAHTTDHITLYANPDFVRAWPKGVGDIKLGANYASTVYLQKQAVEKGCQQVLWLFGPDHLITEVGAMNIFMLWENLDGKLELITPPLNGLILPGITRRSILELTRSWNEFLVTEREFTMKDLLRGIQENRVKEFFGTGTAVVVTPVDQILYMDKLYSIPTVKQANPLYKRILQSLSDIYTGRIPSPWTCEIKTKKNSNNSIYISQTPNLQTTY